MDELLNPNLRQYKHNNGDANFVFAYEKNGTENLFARLISSRNRSAADADHWHDQFKKLHVANGRLRSLLIDSLAALDPVSQKKLIANIEAEIARARELEEDKAT